jgi:hypothetical protein
MGSLVGLEVLFSLGFFLFVPGKLIRTHTTYMYTKALVTGMVHTKVHQKVMNFNLIVRQKHPLKKKRICTKSTNDLADTITMVMELFAPLAAWI